MDHLSHVHTLTFDAFGTILDLTASHIPQLQEFVNAKSAKVSAAELWDRWRSRQRMEQFQDNLFCAGHFGYLDSSRRALLYTLRSLKLLFDDADVQRIMDGWQEMKTFPDSVPGLERLKSKFKLVVLTNGENGYAAHVVKNCIRFEFHRVISVD